MAVPGFPSEAIIDEYLIPKDRLPIDTHKVLSWQFPRVLSAQVVCHRLLEWSFEYTHKKVLSLVTQWCLRREGVTKGAESQGPVTPLRCVYYIHVHVCSAQLLHLKQNLALTLLTQDQSSEKEAGSPLFRSGVES